MTSRTTAVHKTIQSGSMVPQENADKPLRECVKRAVDSYLNHLNGHRR